MFNVRNIILSIFLLVTIMSAPDVCAQSVPQLPDNLLEGRNVFLEKHCDRCHTIGGGGVRDLSKKDLGDSFGSLAARIWNHTPEMDIERKRLNMKWPEFSEKEMVELTAFLFFIPYLGDIGDPDKGRVLINSKKCLMCHQIGERGDKTVGPRLDKLRSYASALYMAASMWNHMPKMVSAQKAIGVRKPVLYGKDIDDLAAYTRDASRETISEELFLTPVNLDEGKRLFLEKGCTICHSFKGQGGSTGQKIEDMRLQKSVTEIASLMWRNHAPDLMFDALEKEGMRWPLLSGQEMADLIAFLYFTRFYEPAGSVADGQRIFEAKNCGECHSVGATGRKDVSDLSKVDFESKVAMMAEMLTHASEIKDKILEIGMDWPTFTSEELRHIFAYLKSVQAAKNR
jgi:cytochrome c2